MFSLLIIAAWLNAVSFYFIFWFALFCLLHLKIVHKEATFVNLTIHVCYSKQLEMYQIQITINHIAVTFHTILLIAKCMYLCFFTLGWSYIWSSVEWPIRILFQMNTVDNKHTHTRWNGLKSLYDHPSAFTEQYETVA